jgi:hypothetical protein
MPVKPLFRGARYEICAWLGEGEEQSAVEVFVLELHEDNDPDAGAMVYELEKTSNHGTSHNRQKFRFLQGAGKDLVEFKARGGSRILAFIDSERRRIVCTHGVTKLKKKRFEREIEKAHEVRDSYLIESLEESDVSH